LPSAQSSPKSSSPTTSNTKDTRNQFLQQAPADTATSDRPDRRNTIPNLPPTSPPAEEYEGRLPATGTTWGVGVLHGGVCGSVAGGDACVKAARGGHAAGWWACSAPSWVDAVGWAVLWSG
jgi:hypothetical protein